MKISFYTFGCTVNHYETQKLRDSFLKYGDEITEENDADIVIINSCAVTGVAEKSVQRLISRLKSKSPNRLIAVVGCYGEAIKQQGKSFLPGVDILLGNDKDEICDILHSEHKQRKAIPDSTQSIGYLQIQNGCDNYCSYCIVPYLRGTSTSKTPGEIVKELQGLRVRGCRDIVLAGLNLGLYKSEGYTFPDILRMVNDTPGVERIRLSSLEPMNIEDRFINELNSYGKLEPHLHISLQSGCDRILKLMNRNYCFEDYLSMLQAIRKQRPGIAISTDVIVGFPGETEKDFIESANNIVRCEFSDIHIFKYSPRKGTPAAAMPDQVSEHQKINRATMLKGIKLQTKFYFTKIASPKEGYA